MSDDDNDLQRIIAEARAIDNGYGAVADSRRAATWLPG
jgi:hypothetical protein